MPSFSTNSSVIEWPNFSSYMDLISPRICSRTASAEDWRSVTWRRRVTSLFVELAHHQRCHLRLSATWLELVEIGESCIEFLLALSTFDLVIRESYSFCDVASTALVSDSRRAESLSITLSILPTCHLPTACPCKVRRSPLPLLILCHRGGTGYLSTPLLYYCGLDFLLLG